MIQSMTKQNGWIAFAILLLVTAIGIYFRPILIIDETRYVSVAWEMWDKGSFLVPLINGEPYHHKPPFLFWLFHLDWWLFGVNETSIRFIPMIFGIGSLILIHRIYLALWQEDREGATLTVLIAAGTVIFAFYNSLIMFDVIVTFFVLLGVYHIFRLVQQPSVYAASMISLAVGLGILTKGPVIVLHLFAFTVFAVYFAAQRPSKTFYLHLFFAVIGGVLVALAWAIPAGIAGGETYRNAIFFGQTANRMVNSFAHQRPVWWYLMLLPLILFPWSLYKPFYTSIKKMVIDTQFKMIVAWLLLTLVLFSLISGKQVHYLMPQVAAFSLVVARALTGLKDRGVFDVKWIGYVYFLFGVVLALAVFILPRTNIYLTFELDPLAFFSASILMMLTGIYLAVKKFSTQIGAVSTASLSIVIFVFSLHLGASDFMKKQDLTDFAGEIKKLQENGVPVVHEGKYHDQYQFYGRLHEPLIVFRGYKETIAYTSEHPDAMVITYQKQKNMHQFDETLVVQKTGFKGKYALMIKAKDFERFMQTKR